MTTVAPLSESNRLLACLPADEYAQLLPHLKPVRLVLKQVLIAPGEPIQAVYFPRSAVASVVVLMQDGSGVEAATIGNEGIVGASTFLGAETEPNQTLIQVGDGGLRMEVAAFRAAVAECPAFHAAVQAYLLAQMQQTSRTAACNRLHSVEQCAARWLLMLQDRTGSEGLSLTQEFLAIVLGVRRPSVSLVAEEFQRDGLINYRRGLVTVRSRAGLEALACEDYALVRDMYDAMFHRLEQRQDGS